jgi:AcrR family transcriptional regulator
MKHVSQSEEEKCIYHSRVRRRILETALSQFENCGYAVTTLEAMTEFGDISPKTIAAVFGSKRALLAEVINPEAFSPST